jgi:protein-S-isoprenylcysteine O-methyltransferase Ste14
LLVVYVSIVIIGLGTILFAWANYTHRTRGGIKKSGETLIFYREGSFKFIRHPGALGFMMWLILLPFILSQNIPFTILTVFAIVLMIAYLYIGLFGEEKLSIEKWGNQYRQYMREVPRFNFPLGIWRHIKRKKSK